jgi:small subunit ribosomal protein S5
MIKRQQRPDQKKRPRRDRSRSNDDQSGVYLSQSLEAWQPKTAVGRQVKSGEIKDISYIFENGIKIVEPQVVDQLLGNLETDLLMIGQSKGKFGGGARRAFKQTQKKTNDGNSPSFSTYAVVGNRNGYVGLGWGKALETVPAREKAGRDAKLNLIYVPRGNGSWQSRGNETNSIPMKVTGKCGSIRLTLIPAPVGTGLVVEKECAKMLRLAGIRDCWSKMQGCTTTKINVVKACFDALKRLSLAKMPAHITVSAIPTTATHADVMKSRGQQ